MTNIVTTELKGNCVEILLDSKFELISPHINIKLNNSSDKRIKRVVSKGIADCKFNIETQEGMDFNDTSGLLEDIDVFLSVLGSAMDINF